MIVKIIEAASIFVSEIKKKVNVSIFIKVQNSPLWHKIKISWNKGHDKWRKGVKH